MGMIIEWPAGQGEDTHPHWSKYGVIISPDCDIRNDKHDGGFYFVQACNAHEYVEFEKTQQLMEHWGQAQTNARQRLKKDVSDLFNQKWWNEQDRGALASALRLFFAVNPSEGRQASGMSDKELRAAIQRGLDAERHADLLEAIDALPSSASRSAARDMILKHLKLWPVESTARDAALTLDSKLLAKLITGDSLYIIPAGALTPPLVADLGRLRRARFEQLQPQLETGVAVVFRPVSLLASPYRYQMSATFASLFARVGTVIDQATARGMLFKRSESP